ncbi:MAG: hypothetical protein O7C56_07420 [Rickettsia endosymbiont of Ixodes persulcatus]|nr:hypothetical protein [Rickettsia endosymbiont of Ixodes persulcatus]
MAEVKAIRHVSDEMMKIYIESNIKNFESDFITQECLLPKGSRIIDLKYFLYKQEDYDPFEFQIMKHCDPKVYTDNMQLLEEGKYYRYHCEYFSTNNLRHQISHPNVHWNEIIVYKHEAKYLEEKYGYTRDPLVINLVVKITKNYHDMFTATFPKFVIDPFMTFGQLKTLIMDAFSDKKVLPYHIDNIIFWRNSMDESWSQDHISMVNETVKNGNANDIPMMNRINDGYYF